MSAKQKVASWLAIAGDMLRRSGRALASLGPRFWFFAVGLGLVFVGAARFSVSIACVITGLLILWDVSRVPPPPAPPPASPQSRRR